MVNMTVEQTRNLLNWAAGQPRETKEALGLYDPQNRETIDGLMGEQWYAEMIV